MTKPEPRTRGRHHDLAELFDGVNTKYLGGLASDCAIGWSQNRRGKKTIRLGSYWPDRKLIRIHPALDRDFVPRYVIEDVIFHEALHHILGFVRTGSGRAAHTGRFRNREAWYPDHDRAEKWLAANLNRLLTGR